MIAWGNNGWIKRIYLPQNTNWNVMKPLKTILVIFLNILFCSFLLWFFSLNAVLRPYLGSITKEFLSGLMLLVTVYANYFLLYPKLYQGHSALYWILVVGICFLTAGVELASGYSFISNINAEYIQLDGGPFHFFPNTYCSSLGATSPSTSSRLR